MLLSENITEYFKNSVSNANIPGLVTGDNGCSWNRRTVADAQFWLGRGIAVVSPMKGRSEDNFWIPHGVCEPSMPNNQTCFAAGKKMEYEFSCTVKDASELQAQFEDELLVVDFGSFNCSADLSTIVSNEPSRYGQQNLHFIVGAQLEVVALSEGDIEMVDLADIFELQSCSVSLIRSGVPLQKGDEFQYTLILRDSRIFDTQDIILIAVTSTIAIVVFLMCCSLLYCCGCRPCRCCRPCKTGTDDVEDPRSRNSTQSQKRSASNK